MKPMIPKVTHSPAILVIDRSSVSRTGRRSDQSIPVEARKCTLSTRSDQATIGMAVATTQASDATGPFSRPISPDMPNKGAISGQLRATQSHRNRPSSPERPTPEETSLTGRRPGVNCLVPIAPA